jgi:hypothetical protein
VTVEKYDPPAAGRQLALVNPVTDSWTAVLMDVVALAENIATTEFVPNGLRGSVPKTVAAILHGRELGLPPMTALAHTSVINGRPGTSAEVMRALILQAGHDLHIERSDSEKCTIRGRRSDWAEDRWTTVTWTITDAAKAGLTADRRTKDGKTMPSMYKLWPAAMLLARATTTLARMIFADVIHGMRSVEELQDMTEPGEWVEPTPPATAQVSRQQANGRPPADESAPQSGGAASADATAGAALPEQQPAAPAPGRKRAPLKLRGRPAAPAPTTDREPADGEAVLDAELVENAPENPDPAPVVPIEDARRSLITKCQMHFERLLGKPVARDERIWWTGIIVGRPVESTNNLDDDELRKLLHVLERLRNRTQLEALAGTPSDDGERSE